MLKEYYDSVGGWAQRLRAYYDKNALESNDDNPRTKFTFYNLAISGQTTEELADTIKHDAASRELNDRDVSIIASGVNDAAIAKSGYIANLEQYSAAMSRVTGTLNATGCKQIYLGLTPCDDERTNPEWRDSGYEWTNKRVAQFAAVLKSYCRKNNLTFIDVRGDFDNLSEQIADGLHPSNLGHEIIAANVKSKLEEMSE